MNTAFEKYAIGTKCYAYVNGDIREGAVIGYNDDMSYVVKTKSNTRIKVEPANIEAIAD